MRIFFNFWVLLRSWATVLKHFGAQNIPAAQKQIFRSARALVKRGALASRFAFPCCAEATVACLCMPPTCHKLFCWPLAEVCFVSLGICQFFYDIVKHLQQSGRRVVAEWTQSGRRVAAECVQISSVQEESALHPTFTLLVKVKCRKF